MHGRGVFFFAYGGYIYGSFSSGRLHGTAILRFPNRNVYLGDWRLGRQSGKCLKVLQTEGRWELCEYSDGALTKTLKEGQGLPPIQATKGLLDDDFSIMKEFLESHEKSKGKS